MFSFKICTIGIFPSYFLQVTQFHPNSIPECILSTFSSSWLCTQHSPGMPLSLTSASKAYAPLTYPGWAQLGGSAALHSVDGAHSADSAGMGSLDSPRELCSRVWNLSGDHWKVWVQLRLSTEELTCGLSSMSLRVVPTGGLSAPRRSVRRSLLKSQEEPQCLKVFTGKEHSQCLIDGGRHRPLAFARKSKNPISQWENIKERVATFNPPHLPGQAQMLPLPRDLFCFPLLG